MNSLFFLRALPAGAFRSSTNPRSLATPQPLHAHNVQCVKRKGRFGSGQAWHCAIFVQRRFLVESTRIETGRPNNIMRLSTSTPAADIQRRILLECGQVLSFRCWILVDSVSCEVSYGMNCRISDQMSKLKIVLYPDIHVCAMHPPTPLNCFLLMCRSRWVGANCFRLSFYGSRGSGLNWRESWASGP